MHILITRFTSLGDVVIQTAFVNAIKKSYPNVFISFVTMKPFASLLEGHSNIDYVFGYEKKKGLEDIKSLKSIPKKIESETKTTIDAIIDLHGTSRSFILKFLNPQITCLNIDKRRLERFAFINLKTNLLKRTKSHQKRLAYDLSGLLNLNLDESITSLNEGSPYNKKELGDYIVLAPIASFAPKRWGIENYSKVIDLFLKDKSLENFKVVILAGASDDYVDQIDINSDRVVNLKGETNLSEVKAIIKNAKLVLGNDTGMGHIAEAFNIPSLVIFGPTHKDLGFGTYRENSKVIDVDLWCRPCSGTGKKKCFRKEQYCMSLISPDRVMQEIKGAL